MTEPSTKAIREPKPFAGNNRSKLDISAFVLTHNDESKIKKCLESLSFCKEIIVVDAGSTDRTQQIAKEFGAKVFYNDFKSLASQKQFALEECNNPWILYIKPEERVDESLYQFLTLGDLDSGDGFKIKILHRFLDNWMFHSGLYPNYKLRLFRKSKVTICTETLDGSTKVEGIVKNTNCYLLSHPWNGLSDFFVKQIKNSNKIAEIKFSKGQHSSFLDAVLRAKYKFFNRYFFQLGFFDGAAGFAYCLSSALVTNYKYLRLWELGKKYSEKSFVPQNWLLRTLLLPLQGIYSLIVSSRAFAFQREILKSQSLDVPVISVGNLTVGGSGKTPFVVWLAKSLAKLGVQNISILSRGYKSKEKPSKQEKQTEIATQLPLSEQISSLSKKEKTSASILSLPKIVEFNSSAEEVGDEPLFMKKQLAAFGVNVLVSASRASAGRYAINQLNSPILILDDGFQHFQLKRNLNICLVDCSDPHGFSLLPLGTGREGFQELKRADAIVLTRSEINPILKNKYLKQIKKYAPNKEVFVLKEEIKKFTVGLTPLQEFMQNKKVLAFCALGNPMQFFAQLKSSGANVEQTFSYRDHHFYTKEDLEFLEKQRVYSECDYMLTTAKDAVKIAQIPDSQITNNIIVAHQEIIGLYRLNDGIQNCIQNHIPIGIDD
ncbi:MAG: tetraacyldisaccharide 4'-kinase, partial [Candidatus Caenarcaniphilales bacterium]|nr:tetraacyldisaccharide 4'-kinase [Candidatus Caenarcaniphilales bacterium]